MIARATEEARCASCGGMYTYKKPAREGKYCSLECRQEGSVTQCELCKKWYKAYTSKSKLCSKCLPFKYQNYDPYKKKAWSLGANILGGKGKTAWVEEQLRFHTGKPCIYCKKLMELDKISLDHKKPVMSSAIRQNKAANRLVREQLDKRENLQFICRTCNLRKGNMSDTEYAQLLEFLDDKPILKDKIMVRLGQSLFAWSYRKGKK